VIDSIARAARRELRTHRQQNADLQSLADRRGRWLHRLFAGNASLLIPSAFILTVLVASVAAHGLPLYLPEAGAERVQTILGYILTAQVTFVALAIPIVLAGAQVLLGGRSIKGRELDIAILFELGRPREITASSLCLIAVLVVMFLWPHEVFFGPGARGARPFIMLAAMAWFLVNVAGYALFIGTAMALVSHQGRTHLRRRAVAWIGFEQEIGHSIRRRLWFEFREELERRQLAWTTQAPAQGEQWYGFARSGVLVDVRTPIFLLATRWLRARGSVGPLGLGIACYLNCQCKPGKYFTVDKEPDLIGRILLRSSLVIRRRELPHRPEFAPKEILTSISWDIEHQIYTGTPGDAEVFYREYIDILRALIRASASADGNYATETPVLSQLTEWMHPLLVANRVAAHALPRSSEFAAKFADSLADACVEIAGDGHATKINRRYAAALGVLLILASRRACEEGFVGSTAHQEFIRHGQRALGRSLGAINLLPDHGDPWQTFRTHAEVRLALLKELAVTVSHVAWAGDLPALRRYAGVLIEYAQDVGPSQIPPTWRRLPEDIWQDDYADATALLENEDTLKTLTTNWSRQVMLDRLFLVQLILAQWIAVGARIDKDWIVFCQHFARSIRGDDLGQCFSVFSFAHLLRRFLAICEVSVSDHFDVLDEFVRRVDGVRDFDKGPGFFYSDAVSRIEDLHPGFIVSATLSFSPEDMQSGKIFLQRGLSDGTINRDVSRTIYQTILRILFPIKTRADTSTIVSIQLLDHF